ncbi:MAG TPA: GTP-binding protein, partial [Pseudogulbenkiania sp.]|nr:GTP-binding protein [Pseudogulbenkiania sp.]
HGAQQLDQHLVARKQAGFADRLLLSKTDLVDEASLSNLSARLAAINSQAEQHRLEQGRIAPGLAFGVRGFYLDENLLRPASSERGLSFRPVAKRSFADDIAALHLAHDGPLDLARISAFMNRLVEQHAEQLLRYKGVLAINGEARRLVFQGVHRITGFDYSREWQDDETPRSDIVLIGQQLPADTIRAEFAACLAV